MVTVRSRWTSHAVADAALAAEIAARHSAASRPLRPTRGLSDSRPSVGDAAGHEPHVSLTRDMLVFRYGRLQVDLSPRLGLPQRLPRVRAPQLCFVPGGSR